LQKVGVQNVIFNVKNIKKFELDQFCDFCDFSMTLAAFSNQNGCVQQTKQIY